MYEHVSVSMSRCLISLSAIAATNRALALIAEWFVMNAMASHPIMCEAMFLHISVFIGPIKVLIINNVIIKVVQSTRCLGVIIDDKLSWTPHLKAVKFVNPTEYT